jgi:uncharacterized protein YecE (DUF72 family)
MHDCELLIGTSGYDYDEWKNVFYPADVKKEDYLPYYAEHFNALELNFSFYKQPTGPQLSRMVERTGGKVKFSIKGNRTFTHEIDPAKWRDEVKTFREALYPFANNNLLTAVLLEFPYSFHYTEDNRRYLASLIAEFHDTPVVIEFRQREWLLERVYAYLDKLNAGLCLCDMPALKDLPALNAEPDMPTDTPMYRHLICGTTGYLRFHGRNDKKWYGTNSRDRYDYLYSVPQLEAYVPIVRQMMEKAKFVQVYFNNHAKGQATINARKLKVLME